MEFNAHFRLRDKHALLSPSKHYWVNYDEERLDRYFTSTMAAKLGTELHNFAYQAIRLGQRLPDTGASLNSYVNDAIGFRMTPEQPLYYSENAFGHADTICFRRNKLRIHDLKTGSTPGHPRQLEVYAALFCLEYGMSPFDIEVELRIYQSDEIAGYFPDPDTILHIMDKIITFDKRIEMLKAQSHS